MTLCLLVVENAHIVVFLPIFVSGYCHSVIYHVSIVSDGINQSWFVFFYVVFESLYR